MMVREMNMTRKRVNLCSVIFASVVDSSLEHFSTPEN
jgi:hypothetical protein